jgi:hypothetical protein
MAEHVDGASDCVEEEFQHLNAASGVVGSTEYVDDFVAEEFQNTIAASDDHYNELKAHLQAAEINKISVAMKTKMSTQYPGISLLTTSSSSLTPEAWNTLARVSASQQYLDHSALESKLRSAFEQNTKREPHPYKGKRSTNSFTIFRKHGLETRHADPSSRNYAFGRPWPEATPYHPRPRSISPTASRPFDFEMMDARKEGRSLSTPKLNTRTATSADGVDRQLVKPFTLAPSPRNLTEQLNISKPVMKHLVVNPRHHTHIYTGMHPEAIAKRKVGSFEEEWNATLKKEAQTLGNQSRKYASRPTSALGSPQACASNISNLTTTPMSPTSTARQSHLNLSPEAAKERAKKLRNEALKKVEVILDTSQRRKNGCGFGAKSMIASPEACKKAMWNNPKSSSFHLTPRVKEHVESIIRREHEMKARQKALADEIAKAKKDQEIKDKIQFKTQYDVDEQPDSPKLRVSKSPKKVSGNSPVRSPAATTHLLNDSINSASPRKGKTGSPSKKTGSPSTFAEDSLLPGWEMRHTADGRVFYAHPESSKTQWTKPAKKKMFSPDLTKKFFGTEFWADEPNPVELGELLTNDLSEVLEREEQSEASDHDARLTKLAGSG